MTSYKGKHGEKNSLSSAVFLSLYARLPFVYSRIGGRNVNDKLLGQKWRKEFAILGGFFVSLRAFAIRCLFHNREPRTSYFNTRMSELIIFERQKMRQKKIGLFCQILNVFSRNFFLNHGSKGLFQFTFGKSENDIS